MKFGLDFHGVIDKNPKLYSALSKALVAAGHEVHIITGSHRSPELLTKIKEEFGVEFTHFFSIADYHKSIGTAMRYDDKGTPWMKEETWNNTKHEYCYREHIDLHFDDSERYLNMFQTPCVHYKHH